MKDHFFLLKFFSIVWCGDIQCGVVSVVWCGFYVTTLHSLMEISLLKMNKNVFYNMAGKMEAFTFTYI